MGRKFCFRPVFRFSPAGAPPLCAEVTISGGGAREFLGDCAGAGEDSLPRGVRGGLGLDPSGAARHLPFRKGGLGGGEGAIPFSKGRLRQRRGRNSLFEREAWGAAKKAFSLRRRWPSEARSDEVETKPPQAKHERSAAGAGTPHQSAPLTASPQGEALGMCYKMGVSSFFRRAMRRSSSVGSSTDSSSRRRISIISLSTRAISSAQFFSCSTICC